MNVVCYQFKHYRNQTLELRASLQVIVGNNGSGKSTLCEALSIMANASNPHHTSWEEKTSFLKEVSRHETEDLLMKKSSVTPEAWQLLQEGALAHWALRWQCGETLFQSIFDWKSKSPKWYLGENSVSKPKYEDVMPYRALWIQSDHLRVISGEPSERRNFLDEMLIFASPVYSRIQKNYKTALASRNRVIQSILDREAVKSDLASWDTLLAEYAFQVIAERRKFFTWLANENNKSPNNAPLIKGELKGDWIETDKNSFKKIPPTPLYQGGIWLDLPWPVKIELMERHPLDSVTKESFLELLRSYTERDLVVGRTTIGPHLDEIAFSVNINWWLEAVKNEQNKERVFETKEFAEANDWGEKMNLAYRQAGWRSNATVFTASNWQPTKYILSRGENKILLLAFIRLLGEYVREVSGKEPLFLLDDVLSELDEWHTEILCGLFQDTTTIMTTQPNHTAGLPSEIVKIEL